MCDPNLQHECMYMYVTVEYETGIQKPYITKCKI